MAVESQVSVIKFMPLCREEALSHKGKFVVKNDKAGTASTRDGVTKWMARGVVAVVRANLLSVNASSVEAAPSQQCSPKALRADARLVIQQLDTRL